MARILALAVALCMALARVGMGAAELATTDEAKAMAVKAADYLKAVEPDKAFAEFNAKDGPWRDRDLYVTVLDSEGVMRANGSNPGLIGKSLINLKDVDGKPFVAEILTVKETGWVSFKWLNPVNKAVEPKTSYWIRTGDYIVGVGAYVSAR